MNKQELINYIKDQNEWSGNHRFILIKKEELISMIEDLDEPQKVKVKQYVADWFEEHKDFLELSLGRITPDIRTKIVQGQALSEFEKWFNKTRNKPFETIIRMKDGYEVEEEPKWVVKIEDNGSAYFVDFFDELQPHLVCGLSGEVMRFDSEDKANAIVTLIECGTVEKV